MHILASRKGNCQMKYEETKAKLDNLVRIQREASTKHEIANGIMASLNAMDVLIYEDIDKVAAVMGLPLSEKHDESAEFIPYTYSFVYEGVTFVSYSPERLGKHVQV